MYLSRLLLDPRHPDVARLRGDCYHAHRFLMAVIAPQRSPADPTLDGRRHAGLLFRLEDDGAAGQGVRLLAQSLVRPDWESMDPSLWFPGSRGVSVSDGLPLLTSLAAGQRYAFRLRANPTRRRAIPLALADASPSPRPREADGGDERPDADDTRDRRPVAKSRSCGRRISVIEYDAVVAWLLRKAERAGFRLLTTSELPSDASPDAGWNGGDDPHDRHVVLRVKQEPRVHGRKPVIGATALTLTFASARFDGVLVVTDAAAFRLALLHGIGTARAFGFGLLSLVPIQLDG